MKLKAHGSIPRDYTNRKVGGLCWAEPIYWKDPKQSVLLDGPFGSTHLSVQASGMLGDHKGNKVIGSDTSYQLLPFLGCFKLLWFSWDCISGVCLRGVAKLHQNIYHFSEVEATSGCWRRPQPLFDSLKANHKSVVIVWVLVKPPWTCWKSWNILEKCISVHCISQSSNFSSSRRGRGKFDTKQIRTWCLLFKTILTDHIIHAQQFLEVLKINWMDLGRFPLLGIWASSFCSSLATRVADFCSWWLIESSPVRNNALWFDAKPWGPKTLGEDTKETITKHFLPMSWIVLDHISRFIYIVDEIDLTHTLSVQMKRMNKFNLPDSKVPSNYLSSTKWSRSKSTPVHQARSRDVQTL